MIEVYRFSHKNHVISFRLIKGMGFKHFSHIKIGISGGEIEGSLKMVISDFRDISSMFLGSNAVMEEYKKHIRKVNSALEV